MVKAVAKLQSRFVTNRDRRNICCILIVDPEKFLVRRDRFVTGRDSLCIVIVMVAG